MKSGNLNFLESSGPIQACNWTALPLPFTFYSNIKFLENPFVGSRVVSCGRTDGHDAINIVFRNFANAPTESFRGILMSEFDCKQKITLKKGGKNVS